jgi:hypothetical protein
MKSGRRAKVQGSGVVRLPWARQINSAFTNSFYSNHVRGRPSVAVSAPILLYIAWVTCLSTKQTDRLRKAAGSGDCQLCQVAKRCCLSIFAAASYHTQVATLSRKLMLHLLAGQANARLFGLDLGDWSVLLGGSILAALVLFLN